MDICHFRPQDFPLPALDSGLDGIPLPNPPCPHGPNIDYFICHEGGNHQPMPDDDVPQDAKDTLNKAHKLIIDHLTLKYTFLSQYFTNLCQSLQGVPGTLHTVPAIDISHNRHLLYDNTNQFVFFIFLMHTYTRS